MSDQCSEGARFQLSEDYLRARRQYEDEWADLAAGIVLFAFKEYVETLYKLIILTDDKKQQQYEAMKKEIEAFFRGPWYTMLTAINPEPNKKNAPQSKTLQGLTIIRPRHHMLPTWPPASLAG